MTEIVAVRGRKLQRQFLAMPFPLYRSDPHWIPPLTYSARRFMDPRRNPYFNVAEIDHFVAVSDGQVVGRISVTIDPEYVGRFGKTAFFGWFECDNDPWVAAALLDRAETWAGERGMQRLAGPYSYCATQEFGLLVEGFDTAPAVFQAHNPPYYADLLRGNGYEIDYRTDTFCWTRRDSEAVMRAALQRADDARAKYELTVRNMDAGRWNEEMDLAYELFQTSFGSNHDMVPMDRHVFDFQADELKLFLDPRLISFVEHEGQAVGFSLLIADANEVLRHAHGSMSPVFLLRMRKLIRQIGGVVVLMIGVRPDAAGRGVGRVLAGEIAKAGLGLSGPYHTVHTSWIHEHNWESRALVRRADAKPYRSYGVFGKAL